MPTVEAFVMGAGLEEQEADLAGSFKRWKHWGVIRDPTAARHADFMEMSFIIPFQDVAYGGRVDSLKTQLRNDSVSPKSASFDRWYGGFGLRQSCFVDNHAS